MYLIVYLIHTHTRIYIFHKPRCKLFIHDYLNARKYLYEENIYTNINKPANIGDYSSIDHIFYTRVIKSSLSSSARTWYTRHRYTRYTERLNTFLALFLQRHTSSRRYIKDVTRQWKKEREKKESLYIDRIFDICIDYILIS